MNAVFIAFYRGRSEHKGLARLADWVTRLVTRSPYSHCEIAVGPQCYDVGTDFTCYSSSFRDGGVRAKTMPLPSDKWDLIEISASPQEIASFYRLYAGKKYDIAGVIGFLLFCRGNPEKWFCSEFCAEFMQLRDAWRYSPGQLHALVSSEWERGYSWCGVMDS
ncbi:TPA: hypothetical protein ACNHS8_002587 [Escherichia coli]|uniref:hypothetical protein n=1 Tax=Escherichia coli TaxID=562 RepID=UPI0039C9287F